MKIADLKSLSVDKLWELHEAVAAELTDKIAAERTKLEDWLRKLGFVKRQGHRVANANRKEPRPRRPYPEPEKNWMIS